MDVSSPGAAGFPRPMSIGEILDRAVSTYVRRVLPLFFILACTVVPVSLIQLSGEPGFAHMNGLLAQMNRLPPTDVIGHNRLLLEAFSGANTGAYFAILILGPGLFYPLSRNAILTYANGLLEGAPVSIGAAYRTSLGRWVPQIVTALGYVVLGSVAAIVLTVAFVLIGVVLFLVFGRGNASGIALLVAMIPFGLALIVGFALLNVAYELASVSVALEEPNPFRAIGNGWRRTFDRALRRRTIGVALAYSAVEVVGTLVLYAVSALLHALAHFYVLEVLLIAIGQIVISGVLGVFVVVYARDVRLRREGYDLLRAASA